MLYLIVGGLFVARETDFDVAVSQVSIITGEEFQALQPESPGEGQAPAELVAPTPEDTPVLEAPPEATAPNSNPAPALEEPEIEPDVAPVVNPPAPPEPVIEEGGGETVDPDATAVPDEAERIEDQVVEAPEPEVETAPVEQAPTAPEPSDTPVQETQEQTAPEETTTQIVTEADEPSTAAPTVSTRPGRKPTPPPAQSAEQETETADPLASAISDAVSEANEPQQEGTTNNANPGTGTGSPITREEKSAFILGIRDCWNVGALGTDALAVTVVVAFEMTSDAKPVSSSISLVSAEGGTGAAVDRAYEAARRAIIRCGADGYGLPQDKFAQWRQVEVRFNATSRQIR